MGKKKGALLWNRQAITLPPGDTDEHDTGLAQPNTGFGDYSPNEPSLEPSLGPAGPIGSRIQVVPLAPLGPWATVVGHSEPYVNDDGKIVVDFHNSYQTEVSINVLFWDPHSMIGPGDADRYGGAH
jgi:hypothetical protein